MLCFTWRAMQEEAWATNDASVSVAAQSCPAHVKEEVKVHMGEEPRQKCRDFLFVLIRKVTPL